MNRDDVQWRGYFSALPTPFTQQGSLDVTAVQETTELFIGQGVHGLLVNGSTGEWTAQTVDERRHVAELVITAARGRVPVLVSATSPDLATSIALIRHAESAGADSVLLTPPPGARLTDAELDRHYRTAFGETGLASWLYNFPQESNSNLSIPLIAKLAEIDNVVAIKQSTPDDREFYATIRAVGDRLVVFGHMLSRVGLALIHSGQGGDGHFGSGMPLGAEMPRFFEHAWRGEIDEAGRIADLYAQLMSALRSGGDDYNWRYGGMQAALKAVMNLQGQPGGYPREPKLPITDYDALEAIATALREVGIDLKDQRAPRA
jgi:4-hydroxy-tetrahydrodipicolinate synthase